MLVDRQHCWALGILYHGGARDMEYHGVLTAMLTTHMLYLQVAGILKLWVASLPEPVVPPRLYDAMLATQTAHADKDAQVAALHSLLRQCEHRVLQVLFPLMEVRVLCCCMVRRGLDMHVDDP